MRRFLCPIVLLVWCALPCLAASSFDDFQKEELDGFAQYLDKETNGYFAFEKEIAKAWGGFKGSTPKLWVDYSQNLSTRSTVNFEKGFVEIESLVPENSQSPVEAALPAIKKHLHKIDSKCNKQAGFSIESPSSKGPTILDKAIKLKPSVKHGKKIVKVRIPLPSDYLRKSAAKYKREVQKNAAVFGIDPKFVFAVIHTESYFNPFARSHVPAFGLMQLVPKSGGRDAYQYVFKKSVTPTAAYLYNPKNNIQLGVAYLGKLKNVYFKGVKDIMTSYIVSVAAYNTGPGNVARAITGTTNLSKTVQKVNTMTPKEVYTALQHNLPYDETKKYVKNVVERSRLYSNS